MPEQAKHVVFTSVTQWSAHRQRWGSLPGGAAEHVLQVQQFGLRNYPVLVKPGNFAVHRACPQAEITRYAPTPL